MELRIPTLEQLRTVYDRDLRTAFPAAELKPLKNMEEMWAEGRYRPWCLFDGDDIAGEAFLWLGHPGWALLDYLCVAADRRNGGLGSVILEKVRNSGKLGYGFDAYKEEYCDMVAAGIIDPAKVTRSALENAASVSAMVLTTESLVADKPEPPAPAAPADPGMGGMY